MNLNIASQIPPPPLFFLMWMHLYVYAYTGFWCQMGFILWMKIKKIKNVFYVTRWPKTMEEWEENFLLVWQSSEVYQP